MERDFFLSCVSSPSALDCSCWSDTASRNSGTLVFFLSINSLKAFAPCMVESTVSYGVKQVHVEVKWCQSFEVLYKGPMAHFDNLFYPRAYTGTCRWKGYGAWLLSPEQGNIISSESVLIRVWICPRQDCHRVFGNPKLGMFICIYLAGQQSTLDHFQD